MYNKKCWDCYILLNERAPRHILGGKLMDTDLKEKNPKTRKTVRRLVILALVLAVVVFGWMNKEKIALLLLSDKTTDGEASPKEPTMSVEYISKKIEKISTLQTAKITYGCMIDFEEGSVKFITKKSFSMYYEATAYAGIDVAGITVTEKDGKYIIQLPPAKIEEKPKIDPASFVFYDKSAGLLNSLAPEDVGKALEYAEKDVFYQATTDQLLDLADSNAIDVLKNLLTVLLDGEQFEIIPGERSVADRIRPPVSSAEIEEYDGDKGYTYVELKQKFEDEGFTNIKTYPIADVKLGVFTKDGEVESLTIGGKESFKKSSVFNADDEVVIKYHTKAEK